MHALLNYLNYLPIQTPSTVTQTHDSTFTTTLNFYLFLGGYFLHPQSKCIMVTRSLVLVLITVMENVVILFLEII